MKTLIFDLDGVIVDTAKYHFIAWKELADKLGVNFTLKDNERLKGVSRMQSFEIILEIGNITLTEAEKSIYCTEKNNLYLKYINQMTKDEILPGVASFISDAKEKGYKIVLGSASKNSMLILDKLELTDLFDAIIDGNKVFNAKPDPEVFTKGADEVGTDYADCIVFEDSVAGIEAAHSGGMKAVGVGTAENLPEADLLIPGFAGICIDNIIKSI